MKVLDVKSLNNDIEKIQKDIKSIQTQISAIQRAIRGLTDLKTELKGKTGEAIRNFYQEVHQPFLIFLHQSLTDYLFLLKEIQSAVRNYEANESGYIAEDFIANDIQHGLDNAEKVTYDLMSAANIEMREVSDIISLQPLQIDEFMHELNEGRKFSNTVIEELYELDHKQTKTLEDVTKDLDLLDRYLNEMSIFYSDGSAIPKFNPLTAFEMPSYKEVRAEVYGTSTFISASELKQQLREMKYDLNTYKGIGLGIRDLVTDMYEGFYHLVTEPEEVLADLGYMILHPVETGKIMKEAIVTSFERDVINGDNESRARWVTYAIGSLAEGVIGTKGAFAGLKISRTGSKVRDVRTKDVHQADRSNVFDYPEHELALAGAPNTIPYNLYNYNNLLDQLLVKVSGNTKDGVYNKGTVNGQLSPSNYPNPDPPMSLSPVRYEPKTIQEVVRMRQGKGPTTKMTHGDKNIEAHHRQQIPVKDGGILDELEQRIHRGEGKHTRHDKPSQLTPSQRAKEIREHYKERGKEYILPGEGI